MHNMCSTTVIAYSIILYCWKILKLCTICFCDIISVCCLFHHITNLGITNLSYFFKLSF